MESGWPEYLDRQRTEAAAPPACHHAHGNAATRRGLPQRAQTRGIQSLRGQPYLAHGESLDDGARPPGVVRVCMRDDQHIEPIDPLRAKRWNHDAPTGIEAPEARSRVEQPGLFPTTRDDRRAVPHVEKQQPGVGGCRLDPAPRRARQARHPRDRGEYDEPEDSRARLTPGQAQRKDRGADRESCGDRCRQGLCEVGAGQ